MKTLSLHPADYLPGPPANTDYGIGFIGCGSIVLSSHLPAYRNCGYRLVAACDHHQEHLREAREQFGVPIVTQRIDDILDNEEVQIIDLAVHARQRLPVVERICEVRPKHLLGILAQKPLATRWADAVRMVELCRIAGITLMVNQQARWAPVPRALKVLIEQGVFGHVYAVTHLRRSDQDEPGSWFAAMENSNIVDHGIHYIDLCRYFTGVEPVRVKATATKQPGQAAVSPMCHTILMEYPLESQLMAVSYFNNIVRAPPLHLHNWFIDGTEASAIASASEITVALREHPDHSQTFKIQGQWFPDAFGGSMGELMSALKEGREPETSGQDNLASIAIAYAAVESAASGNAVEIVSAP